MNSIATLIVECDRAVFDLKFDLFELIINKISNLFSSLKLEQKLKLITILDKSTITINNIEQWYGGRIFQKIIIDHFTYNEGIFNPINSDDSFLIPYIHKWCPRLLFESRYLFTEDGFSKLKF